MDVRSPLFQNVATLLIGVMFLNPILATAAELALDAAGGNTNLGQAANGVPIVNIATPNGSGLSHNKFSDYNVGQQGLILNNATDRTQSTQLGGIILGNPNLKGGAAGLILNEVTGGNPSQLKGYTEVAGRGAHVIVANPHGVTCNGCGFINTPHATLTTGKPVIDNGRLSRFDVDGGAITIEGAGLNASNVEQFDLITRSAKLNAEIYANRLNVITGRNQVDASTLSATAKADNGSEQPQLAIDSSALGGMYAGAIRLVGTEAGVGVKLAGDMAASAGDIQIDANGHLDMARAAARDDLRLTAQSIELNGDAYAGRRAELTASDEISVAGEQRLAAGGDVQLTAAHLNNAGTVESGRQTDDSLNPESTLVITAAGVRNQGQLVAHGALTVNAQELDNQDATLVGDGFVELNVAEVNNRNGQIVGRQALTLTGATLDNRNGTLASNQALTLNASDNIKNGSDGLILSKAGGLQVTTAYLDNAGGTLQTDHDALQVTATTLENHAGKIQTAAGALTIDASAINNTLGLLAGTGGLLKITSAHLDNQQGRIQADALDLAASTELNNANGQLIATVGKVTLTGGALSNQAGTILAHGDLTVVANSLNNHAGSAGGQLIDFALSGLLDNSSGLIEASDRLLLAAATLDNENGKLRALGSVGESRIHAITELQNTDGLVEVGNANFKLSSAQLENYSGMVRHVGNQLFSLDITDVEDLGDAGGSIISNGALTLTAASWVNRSLLQAARLTINVEQFSQYDGGQLLASESFTGTGRDWDNNGLLASDGSFSFVLSGGYSGYGDIHSIGNLSLTAVSLQIGEAVRIASGGTADITLSGGLTNEAGELTAAEDMNITAGTVDNYGTIGSAAALQLTAPRVLNQGLLFSGTDMKLYTDSLTNRYGDLYSLGDLTIAKNVEGVQASLLENRSGSIESAGDMSLRAAVLVNRKELFTLGKNLTSGHISVVCYDCSGDHHNVDYVANESFVVATLEDSAAARIHSGHTLDIKAGTVSNLYSSLSAGGDLTLKSTTLDNTGAAAGVIGRIQRYNTGRITDGTDERFRDNYINPYNAQGLPKVLPTALGVWNLVSDVETFTPTGILAPAIIQAGGLVHIDADQGLSNGTVSAFNSPVAGTGQHVDTLVTSSQQTLQVQLNAQLPADLSQQAVNPLTLPGFSLPSGSNGLFNFNQNPNFPYLIETNPAFANLKNFLSSDYLLSRLGYNTDEIQRRLGDGLYEQRLIQQAIIARTGKRFLADLSSDEAQFRYLMDNAIASQEALQLSSGVALTSAQVAALTHDIVWMQEQVVNGQKVLVPVLYLAQANDRLAPSGALIQGRDVTLIAGTELNNSGTLRASANLSSTAQTIINNSGLMQAGERLSLLATDSIRNAQGGVINGKNVSVIALKGDISNERSISQQSLSGKGFSQLTSVVDSAARIEASNDLSLSAGRDIQNVGGALSAGGKAELAAGGDVIIAAATEEQGQMRQDKRHFWSSGSTTQHGSDVQVGGDLVVNAKRDIAIVASTVKAAGNITLDGKGDVTIASAANETSSEYRYKGNGKKINAVDSEVQQQAAVIEAGGDLTVKAGIDLVVSASQLKAGDEAYLYAGNDLALLVAADQSYHLYDYKKKGSLGSEKTQKDEVTKVTNIGSSITAGGNLTLESKGDQTYQAAHLESGKDLTLDSGGAITFEAVKDLKQESHEKSDNDAFWTSSKGKGTTDETLRQTQLVAAGNITIKAVEGLHIDIKKIDQQSVSQTINAMVKADPQLAWIKQAEARGDVDWRQVQEIHDSFKYNNSGLGPASQLIIAIALAVIVGPAAAGAVGGGVGGAMAGAVATSAATNATVSTINNRGNLGAVVKDVTSSDAIKGYVVAAATAGIADKVGYNPTELHVDAASVQTVGIKVASDAVIKTAVYGGSFKDNLAAAAVGAGIGIAGAVGANQIGSVEYLDGSLQKIVLHAALGGLMAEAMGGDFRTGALAAGANEALVSLLADKLLPQGVDKNSPEYQQGMQNLLAASQIVGVLAAVVTDGDVNAGAAVAANATQNNFLNHQNVQDMVRELEGCKGRVDCQQQVRDRYLTVSDENEKRLAQCKQNGTCEAIKLEIAAGAAAMRELRGLPSAVADAFTDRQQNDGVIVDKTLLDIASSKAEDAHERSQRQHDEELVELGKNPEKLEQLIKAMALADRQAGIEQALLDNAELAQFAQKSDAELDLELPGWREYRQQMVDATNAVKQGGMLASEVLSPDALDLLGPAAKAAKLAGIFIAMQKAGNKIPEGLVSAATKLDNLLAGKAPTLAELAPFEKKVGDKLTADIRTANQTLTSKPMVGSAVDGAKGTLQVVTQYGPLKEGPLPLSIVNTFRSGTYAEVVTQEPTTLYRVYGGGAEELGGYWTRTPPAGPVQSIIDSALNPKWGNTATKVVEMKVPTGTKLFEGVAAAQGGLVGGGNQVLLPKDFKIDPSWIKI